MRLEVFRGSVDNKSRCASSYSLAVAREAIAGAQRRRLVGAAKLGERFRDHAGGILGPGVIRAGSCLMCGQRSLRKGQSLSVAPCVEKEARVITLKALCGRMPRPERLFADGNRSTEQRLGFVSVTNIVEQTGLLRLTAVSGCSAPSAFSRIASARSSSGRAPREVALGLKQGGEVGEARRG